MVESVMVIPVVDTYTALWPLVELSIDWPDKFVLVEVAV